MMMMKQHGREGMHAPCNCSTVEVTRWKGPQVRLHPVMHAKGAMSQLTFVVGAECMQQAVPRCQQHSFQAPVLEVLVPEVVSQ
jgi:hypothetical protein